MSVIDGEADAIIFDDKGKVTKKIELGNYISGKEFYYRISSNTYHMLLVKSETFVFHEATEGPFIKNDTTFLLPTVNQAGERPHALSTLLQESINHTIHPATKRPFNHYYIAGLNRCGDHRNKIFHRFGMAASYINRQNVPKG